jgi:ribonuclease BN (tRNA processing enzyme)
MPHCLPAPALLPDMRLTVIGCGDAFGSGGRFNTCFLIEASQSTFLLDFGASSMVALHARGIDPASIDGVILTHLHGDHFGGLPFFLLDAQFLTRREKPFIIAGPPGTRTRLAAAMEVFFPGSGATKWRFPLQVEEIVVGLRCELFGCAIETTEVLHQSGAPSTAVRISDGPSVLAYSGDTEWTDALCGVAEGTDLFIVECYDFDRKLAGHMNWGDLQLRLSQLNARQIMLTHMNPSMLQQQAKVRETGVLLAADGFVHQV